MSVYDKVLDTYRPHDVKVVQDFLDVFLEELSELPPDQETEFTIDVVPAELKEIKEQL